jgi:hypothetical protein
MLSHAPALAEQAKTWTFLELWIDPILFPPKILLPTLHFFTTDINREVLD